MVTLPVLPAADAVVVAGVAGAATALVWTIAEVVHLRRVRRIGPLAFGPAGRPAGWVAAVPLARALAAGLLACGLAALLVIAPAAHGGKPVDAKKLRHLVIVLDVSPSMQLVDAGVDGKQSRRARAAALIRSLLSRVPVEQCRISVIAVASGALPVVEDSRDPEVLANILDDLPLNYAFKAGKTDLFAGLAEAARLAKPWRPGSATVLVVTDGDTVPATGLPRMPESVSGTILVGVGDAATGKFIDGHMSRQDAATLRQVAARSGGFYHDGNAKHVPTDSLVALGMVPKDRLLDRLGLREYAIAASVIGAGLLAALPAALAAWGTSWRPGVRTPARQGRLMSARARPQAAASWAR